MSYIEQKAVAEGLLFAVGEEGIEMSRLMYVLDLSMEEASSIIEELRETYEQPDRGFRLVEHGGAYRLITKKEHALYYKKLIESPTSSSLSQAALETLAIIAYRQPITRTEIEDIRGVKTDKALQTLTARLLIKEMGRAEGTGRPILYGTTKEFLDAFGLQSLKELPPLPKETEDLEEADLFFDSLNQVSLD
ncbi:SMC-Scp complex subunit ScpB [Ectobacillus antri]|uniref:Segregation and condensation protein B n=1 Tax=Ectobacillus antri TaxID=2486280 RepID=A0ABT6GZI9_9BACI|nr:SMC-Scp complex subunit ScpB [Ectobacillus antri]MDG4655711.1 SMC-Scp complex subunit ScpB [Ectobacillus antri]MDG5752386.1 SMC-Scp complex subunit ScpB [Ectobacillus antri]